MNYLYDTLFFMTSYFNETKYMKTISQKSAQPEKAYKLYFELKNNIGPLPESIRAICWKGKKRLNFLTGYLYPKCRDKDILEVENEILNDPSFQKKCLLFLFPKISEFDYTILTNGKDDFFTLHKIYTKLLIEYELPERLIVSLLLLSTSFSQIIVEFLSSMKKIYQELNSLYNETNQFSADFLSEARQSAYLNEFITPDSIQNYDVDLSLLDPFLFELDKTKKRITLGFQYEQSLRDKEYRHVNIEHFCKLMSSELALSILTTLSEQQYVCAEEIQEKTHYGITYIYKQLSLLMKERLIYCAKKINKVKYYSLDRKYLAYLNIQIQKMIKESPKREL